MGRYRTENLVRIAVALMADQMGQHWGYDIIQRSGLRSGVVYPNLRKLLQDGWLADGWEDPETTGGRPPRRYYTLTDLGRRKLGALIDEARIDPRFAAAFGFGMA
jgi:PadR family transcriptional regulator PadR